MRLAVFIFSLILIVSPIYAHAFAFVPAITGAIVRSGAGQFVKVQSKKALAAFATKNGLKNTLITVATGYCLKNKQKCIDEIGDAVEYFFEDDGGDGLLFLTDYGGHRIFGNVSDMCKHAMSNIYSDTSKVDYDGYSVYGRGGTEYRLDDLISCHGTITHSGWLTAELGQYSHQGRVVSSASFPEHSETQKQQQAQKIIERIKDDDPDYIINNYGDTINIEQYCSAHACDELTAEFGDEVIKNKHKYDIDKINKANCEVENNKIKSCDNAKRDKDDDKKDDTDKEQGEPTDDDKKDDKINCNASDFHKKVCDFIDWYQDDTDLEDDNNKVKVTDLSDELKLDKDRIKFSAQCPPDKTFKMAYAGVEVSPTISYKWLCDAFIMMKPFIIGLSGISAVLIITGGRRG